MYCIKCGVELADSEKKCPLCGTVVYNPDSRQDETPGPFPKDVQIHEEFNRSGILFILTFIFIIPALLTLICDLSLNSDITWSGYCACSIAFVYLVTTLPVWFRKPNPVIFVSADFIGGVLLLFYINQRAGGNWFLTFALPVTCGIAVITIAVISLLKYIGKRGYLYIYGGGLIATGGFMMVIEALLNLTFGLRVSFVWSFYPLIVLTLIGAMLLIIAICKPLRESLRKKFFI